MAVDLSRMQNNARPRALRKHCIDFVRANLPGPKTRVAVPLSSGVDSHVCLFALLACGISPTIYSFTLEDRESRDFRTAKATAEYFGLDFVPVYLSTDIVKLQWHVWNVCHKYLPEYAVGKTTIECTWPVSYLYDQIAEPFFFLGFGGDPPYCSMRKQKKAYQEGQYQAMLERYYSFLHNDLQLIYADRYLKMNKRRTKMLCPLNDKGMLDVFRFFDPFSKQDNPTNKAVSRAAFWEYFSQVRVYGQQGFQKGDSGIADQFERLLETEWQGTGKTVKAVYNRVQRKLVAPPRKRPT